MKIRALTLKILRWLLVTAAGIIVLAIAVVQFDQWTFIYKAAQLKRDIRSLTLRQSTFSQAQALIHRWKSHGTFNRSCSETHCEFHMEIETFTWRHSRWFIVDRPWKQYVYRCLGVRPAVFSAAIEVENGAVWGSGLSLLVGIPFDGDELKEILYLPLIGEASTVPRFSLHPPDYSWNTEYIVGSPSGCEFCILRYANFTPYANPEVVRRLMDINLRCALPWSTCSDGGDIMPGARAQTQEDRAAHRNPSYLGALDEKAIIYAARDALTVAAVEVLATRVEKRGGHESPEYSFTITTVRLLETLKNIGGWNVPGDWSAGSIHELPISSSELRPGRRVILLMSGNELSGTVPLTPRNVELINQGIALDYLAHSPN